MSTRRAQGWLVCIIVGTSLTQVGCEGDADAPREDGAKAAIVSIAEPLAVRAESAAEVTRMSAWVEKHRIDPSKVRRWLWTRQGRRVSCVNVMDQLAVKELGLTTIEAPPAADPADAELGGQRALPEPLLAANSIGAATAACAEGTVPIAEVTVDDLKRFKTVEHFLHKKPMHMTGEAPPNRLAPRLADPPAHDGSSNLYQYAELFNFFDPLPNWGALSTINIWKPYTELSNEHSLSQIWVWQGSDTGRQTVEVGSIVSRDRYGDANPHLFIFSTRDGYQTGCYDGTCGDFVQTGSTTFPGQAISPYSTPGTANQWETPVRWVKNGDGGAWWLWVNGEYVGYYPRSLFSAAGLRYHADHIGFGGEITNHENGNLHTSTEMGSGNTSAAGFGFAAYQSSMRYFYKVDSNGTVRFKSIPALDESVTDANCYDMAYTAGETTMYFGGHGYNRVNCR